MKYVVVVVLAAVMMFAVGCKKADDAQTVQATTAAPAAEVATAADSNSTEQKTCPVMGGEINKKISVDYKGKKVYFCCPGCIADFNKDPNKYIDKLPQFKSK